MITIKGRTNSGTTWYLLHKAVEYCQMRFNHKPNLTTCWYYGELTRNDILNRIERLHTGELIVGSLGCLNLVDAPVDIPYNLDSIIASSLTWNPGDIVVIDAPVTTSINKSDMDNRNVIIQALTALQNHTDVVMYFKEQLSRTYNPVFNKTYKYNSFEWEIIQDGSTHYVNLIDM